MQAIPWSGGSQEGQRGEGQRQREPAAAVGRITGQAEAGRGALAGRRLNSSTVPRREVLKSVLH